MTNKKFNIGDTVWFLIRERQHEDAESIVLDYRARELQEMRIRKGTVKRIARFGIDYVLGIAIPGEDIETFVCERECSLTANAILDRLNSFRATAQADIVAWDEVERRAREEYPELADIPSVKLPMPDSPLLQFVRDIAGEDRTTSLETRNAARDLLREIGEK